MNFKIDENLPTEITGILLNNGYIATTVYDEKIAGCSDKVLAKICKRDNKALITLDLDFSDIRTYKPADYSGIIILRLQYQDKPYILKMIESILPLLKSESIDKKLWIVEEKNIRIRE